MLKTRFFWKLYTGYVCLILLSSLIVGGLIAKQTEQDSLEEIQRSLEATTTLLRHLALPSLKQDNTSPSPPEKFREEIRILGQQIDTRLTVIQTDGLVQADSEENVLVMDNHATRPEILAARSRGQGITTRHSNITGLQMMYFALSVEYDQQLIGYVRASVPLSTIDQRIAYLRSIVILGTAVSAGVALLLGFFVARRFTQPLTSMATVAEAIAEGDYSRRVDMTRQDEIGQLGQVLNYMAQNSNQRMEMINADRNRLKAILAGMVEGVVAIDQEKYVVHMNDAAKSILRTVPGQVEGQRIGEVTRMQEACQMLDDTLRNKKKSKKTLRIPANQNQTVQMRASPLQNSAGETTGVVLVLHDVSDLQRLERIRRDFVANVSHELKTPIAAIRGLVETLLDDKKVSPTIRHRFLNKIQNQSTRASSVVAELLTLSRLESQGNLPEASSVDLCEIIRSHFQILLQAAEEKGINVELDLPKTAVTVFGDEEALRQMMSNLLDNAFKYTPNDGQVWVRLKKANDNAIVEVQDTGIGIESKDQDRIFERFYRVDKARSRGLGGTGLGLAIVKHIALAHGATVTVESIPGQGSTFQVTMPLNEVR